MSKLYTITATVLLQNSLWRVIFERNDDAGYAVARHVFEREPSDTELYNFIQQHFYKLKFTQPQEFKLIIKRKNPKRMQREVRREMQKTRKNNGLPPSTLAQETLREDLEKNKKLKKALSKAQKEKMLAEKFQKTQAKKKQKARGH